VVRSDRGLEYGVCVLSPEDCPPEAEKRYKMNVVRAATDHDNVTHRQILDDEERAKKLCRTKIRERELPMKLVDCEYGFDRRKVIFYFTAEDRVDFRELVRDLAQELKTRIELRHIQVRDEAKMVGGIGSCGRELCCTTWMTDFIPISMKMAKKQNLSLNPAKLSGQCGRLMCCLSYENDLYTQEKRQRKRPAAPKPEDLARVRDKMEANTEDAAEVIAKNRPANGGEGSGNAEKNDGSPRPKAGESRQRGERKGRPRRDRGRGRKPASEADAKNRSNEQSAGGENTEGGKDVKAASSESGAAPPVKAEGQSEGPVKRKRRRRRRSGGGARQKNSDDKGTQN
jgi:cell fate regulator YaaT (PSP1 superfamily)